MQWCKVNLSYSLLVLFVLAVVDTWIWKVSRIFAWSHMHNTHTHAYTRTHTNIHIHTCIHAHPHKHTHAYTGAHTKIHILSFSFNLYASYSDIKITHDTICFLFDTVYLQSVLLCVCVCVWTKQPILFVADSIQCKLEFFWNDVIQ